MKEEGYFLHLLLLGDILFGRKLILLAERRLHDSHIIRNIVLLIVSVELLVYPFDRALLLDLSSGWLHSLPNAVYFPYFPFVVHIAID